MKVMFMQYRNSNSTAIMAVAKILLPDQRKNNKNIKFLKGRGLEYLAQHRSRLNNEFILHLNLEVLRLNNPRMDNHYTLQQIKELDHLTNHLIIPNLTQRNAANQVNLSEFSSSKRCCTTHRLRR